VVNGFFLKEVRTLHTWEELKDGLKDGESSEVLTDNRGYEIDLSPYLGPVPGRVGNQRACIQILHNDSKSDKPLGSRGILNWIGGLVSSIRVAEWLLVLWLNTFLKNTVSALTDALNVLKTPDPDTGYVDQSYKVLNVGAVVSNIQAYALELSMPCDKNLVANVDILLDYLDKTS
jgi:hypothetical protein